MPSFTIAIDQGTTSTRSIVFDESIKPVASAQQEFEQLFPHSGWVEHRPQDLWQTTLSTLRQVINQAGIDTADVAGIGITNQRETLIVWDRHSGEPIANAIVWQDRRTAEFCAELANQGHEAEIQAATGLLIDPYFSASKLRWLLDSVDGAHKRAERGDLLFGTVDCWLVWQLSGGQAHVTDATNAARTQLFNIHTAEWDADMLALFGIPASMLPRVLNCADEFAHTDPDLLGRRIPIRGIAGDQQAALIGQACFNPGMLKSTYGTGCFAVLNTGSAPVYSSHRLLTTIGYRLQNQTTYALEGSIFIAGAGVQWLRDGLNMIEQAPDTHQLATEADSGHHVYLVPAFVGLGAPHWDADARGAIFGLTRNSGPREFARAVLESVGYQTLDLLHAMHEDWPVLGETVLRVDGGMTSSDWTMQFLADMLNCRVDRPAMLETTALGAAYLAGMQAGIYPQPDEFAKTWQLQRTFLPQMSAADRDSLYAGWRDALSRTLSDTN